MKNGRVLAGGLVAVLTLVATGCPSRATINEITGDPGRYRDKEVAVVGRVVNSYGALNKGAFEIDDGTGRMWVVTEKYGVPSKDTYIGVSGRVQSGVSYGGRNYGTVLHETGRRTRERQ
jgi:hypothetical protein